MADHERVRATVLEHFGGRYDADGGRMARELHPELVKAMTEGGVEL